MSMITDEQAGDQPPGFRLTGGKFLAILLSVFAVVATVNGIMVHDALSTFSGEVNPHPYEAGLAYNKEIVAAARQESLHWSLTAHVLRDSRGEARIAIDARDAAGAPLQDLQVVAHFESPTDMKLDREVTLQAESPGIYTGVISLNAAFWDLVLKADRDGKRMFQSKSRIFVE